MYGGPQVQQLRFKTSTSKLHSGLPPTFKLDSQTPPDLQTRFADLHAPTFKLDSQTFTLRPSNSIRRPSRSDLQTRFADLHAPTFKLDSQTFTLRLSNSIPSLSDIHSSAHTYYLLDHVTDESRSVKVGESSLKVGA